MKIINLETELGNKIINELKKEGWKKAKEYSLFAFDKGIDFDSYTLRKNNLELYFEWTNWFEWEINGSESELKYLAEKYSLKIQQD